MIDAKAVAATIMNQLGGNRVNVMIGLKSASYSTDKVSGNVTLTLQWKAKSPYKICKITLNGKDLYDVEFGKIRKYEYIVGARHEDVYADMLKEIFEKETGLYLSL